MPTEEQKKIASQQHSQENSHQHSHHKLFPTKETQHSKEDCSHDNNNYCYHCNPRRYLGYDAKLMAFHHTI